MGWGRERKRCEKERVKERERPRADGGENLQAGTCGVGLAASFHHRSESEEGLKKRVDSRAQVQRKTLVEYTPDSLLEKIFHLILALVLLSSIECSGAIEAESDRLPRGLSISHV